ncbi:HlyD family secretion protein [Bosea sp. BIWAKO-01]|uniref:HlyD family secretion protein n=1 Tax=Bosea sp. BIWAKO-01 TaxID=506668 RepID=UPI000853D762|nr:HlyD family efflux transporter periplasmic adaptor subunit [Bosea sp. BIWAKO-01]
MPPDIHRLAPDLPDPVESRRVGAGRVVRWVYATFILLIMGFFLWRFGSPLIFLSGPGVVSAPRLAVSLPYLAQVKRIDVGPGATVQAGDLIAVIDSPQVDEITASLLRALADVSGREADLRVKARVAKASLDAAKSRSTMAEEAMQRLEGNPGLETASLIYRGEVHRERSLAVQNVAALEAEADEASAQLERLRDVREQIRGRYDQVRQGFDEGRIVAPTSGIVASSTRRSGETVTAGTSLAEIYVAGDTFVDWYIPDFRLVDPQPGQRVFVIWGKARLAGTLTELLPISELLESRRSSILREPSVGQIGRVRFDAGVHPPTLNSTVQVRMFYSHFTEQLARFLVQLFNLD